MAMRQQLFEQPDDRDLSVKDKVEKEFAEQIDRILRQIEVVNNKQTEITVQINTIKSAVDFLRQVVNSEEDPKKKRRYYELIASNIEILVKLYTVWKEFEDVKCRYYRDCSDLIARKNRIVNIELEKLQKDMDTSVILAEAAKNVELTNELSNDEVLRDPKYEI